MLADQSRLQDPGYQPFAVLSMCRALYTVSYVERLRIANFLDDLCHEREQRKTTLTEVDHGRW